VPAPARFMAYEPARGLLQDVRETTSPINRVGQSGLPENHDWNECDEKPNSPLWQRDRRRSTSYTSAIGGGYYPSLSRDSTSESSEDVAQEVWRKKSGRKRPISSTRAAQSELPRVVVTMPPTKRPTRWRTIAQMPVVVEPFDESGVHRSTLVRRSRTDRPRNSPGRPSTQPDSRMHRRSTRRPESPLSPGLPARPQIADAAEVSTSRGDRPRQHSAHHPAAQEMSGE